MSKRPGGPVRPTKPTGPTRARFRKSLTGYVPGLATLLVRLICGTLRIRCENEENYLQTEGGRILCLWHGRAIPPTARYLGEDITVLISLSRDGELISRVLGALGFPALRGSSGPSGARVLASCIKLLRGGRTLAVTPDGPRGPSGVIQGGVMTMAKKSGCTVVPVGSSARPRIVMDSWDQYVVPLPFAKAVMIFGEPVNVPPDADEATVEALRQRLEAEMRRLQDEADRRLSLPTFAEIASKRNG